MQCASCQFENMPGTEICGRCGTSLRLNAVAIDVHPPRAGDLKKRMRRLLRPSRRARPVDAEPRRASAPGGWLWTVKEVCRLAVPGWPQRYAGRTVLWRVLAGMYVLLVAAAVASLGSVWSGVLAGLAFAVHSAGVFHALSADVVGGGVGRRLARSAAITIVLAMVLYGPLLTGLSYIANPITVAQTASPLAAGDVLLVQSLRAPRIGSLVQYDVEAQQALIGYHTYAYIAGRRIDRVLAGPGSHVLWENGTLTVNGAPSLLRPLNPAAVPVRLELRLGDGQYFILPTTPGLDARLPLETWQRLSVVPEESLRGSIYLRIRPLARWGRL